MIILQQTRGNLSSGDQLSLDLPFAETKSLTARVGPNPVFSRASTGTFVGSDGLIQSAAINAARFDHNPITGVCRGLLIEESRTNRILQSENFGTTWALINATASLNVATAPDGSTSADKIINNSGASGRVQQVFTLSGSNVYSVFAKADEWNWLLISPLGGGTGVWFNLSNGTVGTQLSGSVGSITSFGNGWYRCSVVFTGAGVSNSARISPTNANNTLTDGNGTSGILIWGAQLEAGSFATSYIPTVASSVVRSADVCSISGADFTSFYNQSEGTIIASAVIDALTGNNRGIYGINNNTGSHGFATLYNAASSGVISQSRNTASTTLSPTFTNSAGVKFTRSLAYYLGGCSIATNGSAVTDTAATISTQTMLTLQIGNMLGGSFQGTCHIPSIRYYRKRLPNAKLAQLTA